MPGDHRQRCSTWAGPPARMPSGLVDAGYTVHLVDPVPRLVALQSAGGAVPGPGSWVC